MLLSTSDLTKTYDGVTAVDGVDFAIDRGELCSVIGPNGAGKTTFFDLLTGTTTPTSGRITFDADSGDGRSGSTDDAVDVTDAPPHETALLGIHRSYQITNVFPSLSVHENVRIAVQANRGMDSWRFWRNATAFDDHAAAANAILERVGLDADAERPAEALSHGEKRTLEVSIALAGDPDLLLLDEPTAGVSSEDVHRVTDLIADVAADHTIMLIEHNMDVVMDISDRVVVLNRGEVIADGAPSAVRESEAVRRAYLGGYGDASTDRSAAADRVTDDGSTADESEESGVSAG